MPNVATPPTSVPPDTGPELEDNRSPRRRRIATVAALIFTVATFGVWIYAIFFYDPGLLVDELADRTFPTQAEKVCAAAAAELDALPPANLSKTATERAAVVEQADAVLRRMVDGLEPLVPTADTRVNRGISEWVTDWNHHIEDRQKYVAALRTNPDARFEERTKGTKQLSLAIDSFAQVNRMTSCSTPGDVG